MNKIKEEIFLRMPEIDNSDLKDDLYYLLDTLEYNINLKNKFYNFLNTLINSNKTVEEIEFILKRLVIEKNDYYDPDILNIVITKKIMEAERQASKTVYPKRDLEFGIWEGIL